MIIYLSVIAEKSTKLLLQFSVFCTPLITMKHKTANIFVCIKKAISKSNFEAWLTYIKNKIYLRFTA